MTRLINFITTIIGLGFIGLAIADIMFTMGIEKFVWAFISLLIGYGMFSLKVGKGD